MSFLSSILFLMWSLRDLRSNLILPFPSSLVTKKGFRPFLSFRGFLCQMEIADISLFFFLLGMDLVLLSVLFSFEKLKIWKIQSIQKITSHPDLHIFLALKLLSLFTHLKDSSINIIY